MTTTNATIPGMVKLNDKWNGGEKRGKEGTTNGTNKVLSVIVLHQAGEEVFLPLRIVGMFGKNRSARPNQYKSWINVTHGGDSNGQEFFDESTAEIAALIREAMGEKIDNAGRREGFDVDGWFDARPEEHAKCLDNLSYRLGGISALQAAHVPIKGEKPIANDAGSSRDAAKATATKKDRP